MYVHRNYNMVLVHILVSQYDKNSMLCLFCTGIRVPPPSLGLTQVAPAVENAVEPESFYTCSLMDGDSRVNEQIILFYTLRGM